MYTISPSSQPPRYYISQKPDRQIRSHMNEDWNKSPVIPVIHSAEYYPHDKPINKLNHVHMIYTENQGGYNGRPPKSGFSVKKSIKTYPEYKLLNYRYRQPKQEHAGDYIDRKQFSRQFLRI